MLQWSLVAASVVAITLAVTHLTKTVHEIRPEATPAPVALAVLPFDVLNRQEVIGHQEWRQGPLQADIAELYLCILPADRFGL